MTNELVTCNDCEWLGEENDLKSFAECETIGEGFNDVIKNHPHCPRCEGQDLKDYPSDKVSKVHNVKVEVTTNGKTWEFKVVMGDGLVIEGKIVEGKTVITTEEWENDQLILLLVEGALEGSLG